MSDVQVVDVHKAFGETRALDGVRLSAKAGEIHAVIGENGCGKSTLAKVLSGIHPIDRGSVSIFGGQPTDPVSARRLGIATIFQEILVAEDASVLENLFVGVEGLWQRTWTEARKRQKAHELLNRFTGTSIDLDAPVRALPLSVKQWIVICRALIGEPRLLIFDESSAALDLEATARLHDEMRRLRDGGACVIIVTHRIAELVRIAEQATVLRDGRTVGVLQKGQITEANLLALMTGEGRVVAGDANRSTPREAARPVLKASGLQLAAQAPAFDFVVQAGSIVGVTGLDGAGQDAFVRALAGVARPLAGTVECLDADGHWQRLATLADAGRLRVAFVSGDRKREGIFANLSIFENLVIALYPDQCGPGGWIPRGPLEQVFRKEARRLSLRMGAPSNLITSLSGGNQQKVLISRALAQDPQVIVLNDPARGVDLGTKRDLYRELDAYAAAGGAVVYLSSELEEFIGFADRVAVFHRQSVFAEFEAAAVSEHTLLPAMFGQREAVRFEAGVAA